VSQSLTSRPIWLETSQTSRNNGPILVTAYWDKRSSFQMTTAEPRLSGKQHHESITTVRMTTQPNDMKPAMDDESDAESFHSARSSVTRQSCKRRLAHSTSHDTAAMTSPDSGLKHDHPRARVPSLTRPRPRTTHSQTSSAASSRTSSQLPPRPKSPRQKSLPIVPRRRGSSQIEQHPPQRRPRQDPAALHFQSCQLFSSLDGMLSSVSREITPLPSVSTSRTTTRHASLVPDGTHDPEQIQRMCAKLDARLAMAAELEVVEMDKNSSPPSMQHSRAGSLPYTYSPALGSTSGIYSIENSPTSPTFPSGSTYQPQQFTEQTSLLSRTNTLARTVTSRSRPPLNTVISWTSNASRRVEYEKIDAAHSGVRGAVKKVLPQCWAGRKGRKAFFTGECDGGSVRRFRMDVDDHDQGSVFGDDQSIMEAEAAGEETVVDEKTALRGQQASAKFENVAKGAAKHDEMAKAAKKKDRARKKPWWSCGL
jgi:hypothetical protein